MAKRVKSKEFRISDDKLKRASFLLEVSLFSKERQEKSELLELLFI